MGENDASWNSAWKSCSHCATSLRMKPTQVAVKLNPTPAVLMPVEHLDSGHRANAFIVVIH